MSDVLMFNKCSLFGVMLENPTFLRLFNSTLASFWVPVDSKFRQWTVDSTVEFMWASSMWVRNTLSWYFLKFH